VLVYASLLIPPAGLAGAKRVSQASSAILNAINSETGSTGFCIHFILGNTTEKPPVCRIVLKH
jgi:hypothetical protein